MLQKEKNTSTIITLPSAYTTTKYSVVTTLKTSQDLDDQTLVHTFTTANFTAYMTSAGGREHSWTAPTNWIAIGY